MISFANHLSGHTSHHLGTHGVANGSYESGEEYFVNLQKTEDRSDRVRLQWTYSGVPPCRIPIL